jgi:hypothetical protein
MIERLLGGLLPARWAAPVWRPAGEQLVLINWLYTEIDARGEEHWPILRELRGWRNIEVREIVSGKDSLDWTVRMFAEQDVARAKADFRGAKEWAAAQTSRWKAVAWARSR